LAFSLIAVGCQGNESVAPPTTGWVANTLRLGQGSDFRSLDPAVANDTVSVPIMRVLFQPLLDYDDGVNLVPLTAEALPTLSKDGKTYTFHLRKDVHFSNGRAVTAEDYLYSWRRVVNPKTKSPWASFVTDRIVGAKEYAGGKVEDIKGLGAPEGKAEDIKGLRAPDPYTLEVELIHPDLTFPYVAAMPFLAPVPREAVEAEGVANTDWNDHFALHPVGNGPFIFKSWNRGLQMRFERDPHYWGPKPAALDAIDIQFGLDPLTLQMMFERGELDLLDRIPSAAYVRLRNDARWKPNFESLIFNGVYYLDMNCEMEPFNGPDGKKVRQAINYAVNKARLVQLGNGRYQAAAGIVPPNMPNYHSLVKGYPYDPKKAKELLAEAGYSEAHPVHLELWLSSEGDQYSRMSQMIQQDLTAVGVEVKLNPVNYSVFNPAVSRRRSVAFSIYGWFQDYPDPSDFLDVLFSTKSISDVESNNLTFYSSPEVDKLLEEADQETNPEKRMDLYAQAEKVIVDDAPVAPLLFPVENWLHQSWVKGFTLHPVWLVRYEKISISPP
jgi:oligopeptide transport system substrate-binding protein